MSHSLSVLAIGRLRLLAMLFICALSASLQGQEANPPGQVIARFHETLIDVMRQAEQLEYQGRFERLKPVIEQVFAIPTVANIVLGRYWDQLSPDQQLRFVESFAELSAAAYASRFDNYSGERFERVSEQVLERGDAYVRTRLVRPAGDDVRFDYILRKDSNEWRVVNIIVDGVSDLAIRRSEYTSIMRNEGFDALMRKLDEQIDEYAQGSA